jgi:hypothetical protein
VAGGCVRTRFAARLSVSVTSSARLRSVHVLLDGRLVKRARRRRFSVSIDARRLTPGTHELRVVATDSGGRSTSLRRLFTRCRPLLPPAFTG